MAHTSTSTSGSGSGVAAVICELESLRFSFLHASIGLPLPSLRHLMALARLRPSALPLDPRPTPPTAASSPQGGGSSHASIIIISPRIGPLPTWTIQQTRAFGQLFLDKMKQAAAAQDLPLDAYALTAATIAAAVPAARLEAWHRETVAAFNGGSSVTEIARGCQQQQQQPAAASGPVNEATVLRWLAEAEALGLAVAWEQRLCVAPALLEAVGVAVDVAGALEAGRDPLALDFPLQCLRQLLPDFGEADVLAGLCALRHQQRQRQRQWHHQKACSGSGAGSHPSRAPLAPLPCPPTRQAPPPPASLSTSTNTSPSKPQPPKPVAMEAAAHPAAPTAQPLEAQVIAVLQARASAPEGVSVDECVRALAGKAPRAAVEACLVGLEESFMAYRGPGGGFKLL